MKHIFCHIVLLSAISLPIKCISQCEPWCQGEGGYYITYNAYPHSLWWHRHQKQEVYKEASIGRFFNKDKLDNIVPIATPPNMASNTQYYYGEGLFYIYNQGGYVVVPAPIGYTVPDIPYNARKVAYRNVTYYYYSGNFFIKNQNNYYTTVEPPVGLILSEIPRNSTMQNNGNGDILFRYGNTYYQPLYVYGMMYYRIVNN